MSRKQYHARPEDLIHQKKLIATMADATLIVALTILYQEADWDAKGLNEFKERYIEFLDIYRDGEIDINKLAKELYDVSGIELLKKWSKLNGNDD